MEPSYSQLVAAEVRAEAARRRVTGVRLACALGISSMSVSKRLNGLRPFTVDELAIVARELDMPVSELMAAADNATIWLGTGTGVEVAA